MNMTKKKNVLIATIVFVVVVAIISIVNALGYGPGRF